MINGMELRWYSMESFENSPVMLNGKIIERIGNSTGFLVGQPGYCVLFWEEFGGPFRCYSDDGFPTYQNPDDDQPCDYITGINEITNVDLGLLVYPNPASETINISVGDNVMVERIQIYEISGRFVLEKSINGLHFGASSPGKKGGLRGIDVRNLQPGTYLLEVETENGYRDVKRFVIE
jgi:hypothetical protein